MSRPHSRNGILVLLSCCLFFFLPVAAVKPLSIPGLPSSSGDGEPAVETQMGALGREGLTSRRAGKHLLLCRTCEAGKKKSVFISRVFMRFFGAS